MSIYKSLADTTQNIEAKAAATEVTIKNLSAMELVQLQALLNSFKHAEVTIIDDASKQESTTAIIDDMKLAHSAAQIQIADNEEFSKESLIARKNQFKSVNRGNVAKLANIL